MGVSPFDFYVYIYLDPLRGCQLKKLGWQSAISWGLNFRSPHFGFADVSCDHSLKSDIGMIPLDESWWIIWEFSPEADIAIEEHQLWQMSCSCWDGFQTRSCCYYAEATLWSPTAPKFFLPSPGEVEDIATMWQRHFWLSKLLPKLQPKKLQGIYTTWKVDGATPMYWFIMAPY